MNANENSINGDLFVPPEVKEYIGEDKVGATYKEKPEDFFVEERTTRDHVCTARPENDLSTEQVAEMNATGREGLVGVTLVKRLRTPYDVHEDLCDRLEAPRHNTVTYGGLKDRVAVSGYRAVLCNVYLDDVLALCGKKFEHGDGWWMMKDAALAREPLKKGKLVSNRFTLKVQVPGLKADQITAYVEGKLEKLRRLAQELGKDLGRDFDSDPQILIPNAFGGQRDGKRRNQKKVGETLLRKGPKAAVKIFLCENGGNESQLARKVRDELATTWGWMEYALASQKDSDCKAYFQEMQKTLEQPHPFKRDTKGQPMPVYEVLSLSVEYEIVKKLAGGMSYEQVMQTMFEKFSLWIGAYQAYWFNQVLARVLRKEIVLRGTGSIPLFMCTPQAFHFYKQHCPEALPLKDGRKLPAGGRSVTEDDLEVDPSVRQLFLLPRKKQTRDGQEREDSPWRKALIPVIGLTHRAEDGVWYPQFELRSGAYATVLLECLFNIDQNGGRYQNRPSFVSRRDGRRRGGQRS